MNNDDDDDEVQADMQTLQLISVNFSVEKIDICSVDSFWNNKNNQQSTINKLEKLKFYLLFIYVSF